MDSPDDIPDDVLLDQVPAGVLRDFRNTMRVFVMVARRIVTDHFLAFPSRVCQEPTTAVSRDSMGSSAAAKSIFEKPGALP